MPPKYVAVNRPIELIITASDIDLAAFLSEKYELYNTLIGTHPAAAKPVRDLEKKSICPLFENISNIALILDKVIATKHSLFFPILSASNPIGILSNNCAIAYELRINPTISKFPVIVVICKGNTGTYKYNDAQKRPIEILVNWIDVLLIYYPKLS
ncbi:MAG: hypothetical protein DK305_000292 [Chloroflexi bacterium]|jgi:hypothetical protein|nr:MAG: hypothetical protein DK305_000292 [Chloroflexota bacterium]|tara:strand:- start:12814 stop:13281 length:468 start_codon:yes stop_codon:yes gene_type:complete